MSPTNPPIPYTTPVEYGGRDERKAMTPNAPNLTNPEIPDNWSGFYIRICDDCERAMTGEGDHFHCDQCGAVEYWDGDRWVCKFPTSPAPQPGQ